MAGTLIFGANGCYLVDAYHPTLPPYDAAMGYCYCDFCSYLPFNLDNTTGQYVLVCPSGHNCTQSVEIPAWTIMQLGGDQIQEPVYCLGESPEAWVNILNGNMEENQGHVNKCWDDPLCARTPPECAAGYMDCPAFTEEELSQILPPSPAACTCGTGPDSLAIVGVPESLSDEEKERVAIDKLIPLCMVHGVDVPPWDDVTQRPGRYCFIPNGVSAVSRWYGGDELDPPAMSSSSTIFEVPPDGESYGQVDIATGRIYAYLSGKFAIEFFPTCMEDGPACPVILSYLQLDTMGFDQGPWTIHTGDGDYVVEWFTVLNQRWIEGTMTAATVHGYSDILLESEIDLYLSGQTNDGLKGMHYTEAVGRQIAYNWDTRTAYVYLNLPDPLGDLTLSLVGHVIAQPPDADAGADIFVPCEQESIRLDGSSSSDRDSDIATYSWMIVDRNGDWRRFQGKVVDIPILFDPGSTSIINLDVVDQKGLVGYDQLGVTTGLDDKPPVIASIDLPASCLWPANHQKVKFKLGRDIRFETHDVCSSGPVDVKIVNATSDEPEVSWQDSVKTQDDVTFNNLTSTVCMRAERTFMGFTDIDGRHYTIVLEFKDKAGNRAQGSVVVRVPMSFGETEKQTCGDWTGLEFVVEDDQECFGSEGQYPPAPPPPGGCFPSSIAPRDERTAGMPLFLILGALLLMAVIRLRRK